MNAALGFLGRLVEELFEEPDVLDDLDIDSELFAHLPMDRVDQLLALVHAAAGHPEFPLQRLVLALDQENLATLVHHYTIDADNGNGTQHLPIFLERQFHRPWLRITRNSGSGTTNSPPLFHHSHSRRTNSSMNPYGRTRHISAFFRPSSSHTLA